jgi:hypothetical protein
MKTVLLILAAMSLGASWALLVPPELVLGPILVSFLLCIFLAWYVAFQNKAVQVTPFRLFFWPWVDVTAPLRNSRALRALYTSAAFGTGGCLGLLAQAASA